MEVHKLRKQTAKGRVLDHTISGHATCKKLDQGGIQGGALQRPHAHLSLVRFPTDPKHEGAAGQGPLAKSPQSLPFFIQPLQPDEEVILMRRAIGGDIRHDEKARAPY